MYNDYSHVINSEYFLAIYFQSTVQLGLDFLSPESLGEAVRLAEEIRCLPPEHDAKRQVLEVKQNKPSIGVLLVPIDSLFFLCEIVESLFFFFFFFTSGFLGYF